MTYTLQRNIKMNEKDYPFQPHWYTIPEFSEQMPQQPYHKEYEPSPLHGSRILNLHILARSEYFILSEEHKGQKYLLRITADDYYKVYINGKYIGQGPAPAYPEKYYYNTYDITKELSAGDVPNLIAVHLYYQGLVNRVWNSGEGRMALAAEILEIPYKEILYKEILQTSLLWSYKKSEAYTGDRIGYDTQFLENFDSRLWDKDWKQRQLNQKERCCGGWKPMERAVWADYKVVPQPTKQLLVYQKRPALVKQPTENTWFIDAGEEVTGGLYLRAEGKAGQKIRILCGEELTEEGKVRYDMRCGCKYEEIWTLADGECELEPFDYKGFRYALLEAEKGVIVKEIQLSLRHYPLNESLCTLKTDNIWLNRIFLMCKNTVKYGTQEAYLDCPTREKGQYLGDAVITARSQVWLTGSTEMLRKCIDQFSQTSAVCSGLLAVAPGSTMQEIADFSLLWPELLMTDYLFTGDKKFLAKYYPVAEKILNYFSKYAGKNGLLNQVAEKWNLVDWPENLRDNYDFSLTRPIVNSGYHNVINALYAGAVKTVSYIEEILGYPARNWTELRDAYCKMFFREKAGVFADSEKSCHASVHSNIYALYFGLVPEKHVETVADFLVKKGFCCGVMLSYYMLNALARAGRYREVYQLVVNQSEHGWVNMLRENATTCFEAWGKEQKWNTSLCHPWATAPISIIIEQIAGIKPEPKIPQGYQWTPHIPESIKTFELKVPWKNKELLIRKAKGQKPELVNM